MTENDAVPMNRAAELLGVYRWTVSDFVRKLELDTKPLSNGRARGLTRDQIELIRERLRPARVAS